MTRPRPGDGSGLNRGDSAMAHPHASYEERRRAALYVVSRVARYPSTPASREAARETLTVLGLDDVLDEVVEDGYTA